jgi:hypothetical protein
MVFLKKKKEVARGGELTQVLSISFFFSFFTPLPLSHIGSLTLHIHMYTYVHTYNLFQSPPDCDDEGYYSPGTIQLKLRDKLQTFLIDIFFLLNRAINWTLIFYNNYTVILN